MSEPVVTLERRFTWRADVIAAVNIMRILDELSKEPLPPGARVRELVVVIEQPVRQRKG